MLHHLLDFLKRSPRAGDRKDPIMPTEAPAPPAPPSEPAATTTSPPPPTEEFHRQVLALADAVRDLSRSQQTLIDALSPKPTQSTPPAPQTVTGDPGDGLRPSAVVDYTRLSPVQQIALGLRTATPQGPRVLPVRAPASQAKRSQEAEVAAASAD